MFVLKDIYIYDGSFNNLLNTIEVLINRKIKPLDIVIDKNVNLSLFSNFIKVCDSGLDLFGKRLRDISSYFYRIVYDIFLSDSYNKELVIYYFILNGLKYGKKVIYLRKLKCVDMALRISSNVHAESHKWKGFLRFQELQSHFLVAFINPNNDVLEYLGSHFKKRLSNESWLICDVKRKKVCLYCERLYIFLVDELPCLLLSNEEYNFNRLWQTFYDSIAIKERKNLRCQMNNMPKRYWRFLVEMRDKIESSYSK